MKELNKFTNDAGMTIVLLYDEETKESHVIADQGRRQVLTYRNLESARRQFLTLVTCNIR